MKNKYLATIIAALLVVFGLQFAAAAQSKAPSKKFARSVVRLQLLIDTLVGKKLAEPAIIAFIKQRGVDFTLTAANKKLLDEAGASPELVAAASRSYRKAAPQYDAVVNGKASKLVQPKYPQEARESKVGGVVSVYLMVSETGDVISAEAVSGPALLRAASVEAARASKFTPMIVDGEPVLFVGLLNYNFSAQ